MSSSLSRFKNEMPCSIAALDCFSNIRQFLGKLYDFEVSPE